MIMKTITTLHVCICYMIKCYEGTVNNNRRKGKGYLTRGGQNILNSNIMSN